MRNLDSFIGKANVNVGFTCRLVVLKAWTLLGQQHQLHLGICWKFEFLSPIPSLLIQKLWGVRTRHMLLASLTGGSDVQQILRSPVANGFMLYVICFGL